MLYRLLLLGQIPGTNIDLSFWQIVGGLLAALAWFGLHWYEPYWLAKSVRYIRRLFNLVSRQLHFIRLARLIAHKG